MSRKLSQVYGLGENWSCIDYDVQTETGATGRKGLGLSIRQLKR